MFGLPRVCGRRDCTVLQPRTCHLLLTTACLCFRFAARAQLAFLMALMYLCVRWVNWGAYIRALTLVGLCVPAVWAPMMILQWRRRSNALALQWDLRGAHEAEYVPVVWWGGGLQCLWSACGHGASRL